MTGWISCCSCQCPSMVLCFFIRLFRQAYWLSSLLHAMSSSRFWGGRWSPQRADHHHAAGACMLHLWPGSYRCFTLFSYMGASQLRPQITRRAYKDYGSVIRVFAIHTWGPELDPQESKLKKKLQMSLGSTVILWPTVIHWPASLANAEFQVQ